MNSETLTKTIVAKRQLVTAINLFFNEGDPVSIFTLSSNAWEIIDSLCDFNKISSVSNETREHVPQGKDLKRDFINLPYRNYFKHADKDPEAELDDFKDEACDELLFLATEDYIRLNKASPTELQVYQLWYSAVHYEKVADDSSDRILEAASFHFPDIRSKKRSTQKDMGKKAISDAYKDKDFLSNPLVEKPI